MVCTPCMFVLEWISIYRYLKKININNRYFVTTLFNAKPSFHKKKHKLCYT